MDICGEHGDDIAYSKDNRWSNCPACDQIEQINKDHQAELGAKDEEIDNLNTKVTELEEQL